MKITVVGLGYVGLSNALILAQQHCVTAFDIDENRIHQLNQKISPIQDKDISLFLDNDNLNFKATSNKIDSYINAEVILIATPTNYDTITNQFDTSSVEQVIHDIQLTNPLATIIILFVLNRCRILCVKPTGTVDLIIMVAIGLVSWMS